MEKESKIEIELYMGLLQGILDTDYKNLYAYSKLLAISKVLGLKLADILEDVYTTKMQVENLEKRGEFDIERYKYNLDLFADSTMSLILKALEEPFTLKYAEYPQEVDVLIDWPYEPKTMKFEIPYLDNVIMPMHPAEILKIPREELVAKTLDDVWVYIEKEYRPSIPSRSEIEEQEYMERYEPR